MTRRRQVNTLAELELYEPPELESGDGRDRLRHELACWPYVTDAFGTFLDSLHWRQRAAVVYCYGDQMDIETAGYRLGVSPRTVQRDIQDVATLVAVRLK
jgi:DNA-directed RNA polymerase specialized sigma24 family protein